jgi:ubiquinone/menaquinone biosynthesis C-methylase UbiE
VAKPIESGRKRAIEHVDPQPEDRVLILGCGTGMDLEYLLTDASVTAIDVIEGMVERTRRRAESLGMDVDARVGDAQSLPFEDGAFDVVLLHLIISVVPDPSALVEEATRVLAADSSGDADAFELAMWEFTTHRVKNCGASAVDVPLSRKDLIPSATFVRTSVFQAPEFDRFTPQRSIRSIVEPAPAAPIAVFP